MHRFWLLAFEVDGKAHGGTRCIVLSHTGIGPSSRSKDPNDICTNPIVHVT